MLKNDHMVFVYVDRAQIEQQLNLVRDRGIYLTSCNVTNQQPP